MATPLPDNASLVLGPPIVGIVLNWFFYGILVMQYFMYFNSGNRDKIWIRAAVHFIFLLDTIQSIMVMDDLFFWFVYNFSDYTALFKFNIATVDGPFFDAFIMFTVQLVYCWRVRELSKWTILPAMTAFLALVSCVAGMFIGIKDVIIDASLARQYRPVEELWLLASAVTDIIIAASMAYLLTRYRKDNYVISRSMMAVLKRILLLTLETNAVTAAFAIALVLTFFIPPVAEPVRVSNRSSVNLAVLTLKFLENQHKHSTWIYHRYSNCFMVLLNQRIYYNNHGKSIEMATTLGGGSDLGRAQHSGQTHTTGSISMIRFNESRTAMGTGTAIEADIGSKNGQDLIKSLPGDVV
ncbi:hypothetical protein D9756_009065 [Leucocoprinus leucothites]|uniref:DUF6534 domain-containing protein n=1 Tax=Leucocoprinus leucothites TaxID=201217 RepID=A0A8H5D0U2_9AGAR|nr:hypothetical protein D9756_009065 [Leucoagaricus leucothites]